MLIYEYKSIDKAMQALFAARKQRNPSYSVRAFAKTLRMSHSSVSSILSGKQNVSPGKMRSIGDLLGLSSDEQSYLVALAEWSGAKTDADRKAAKLKLAAFGLDSPIYQVTKDQTDVYGSWEALAIVEALKLTDSKRSVQWLSAAIERPVKFVESICDVLVKLNFIVEHEDETYSVLREHSSSEQGHVKLPPKPVRQFHSSVLQAAMVAIDDQPLDERDFSAVIYAASADSTPAVKRAIKEFRRAIMAAGETAESKDSVYCLAIQWFKLAESPTRKRKRLSKSLRPGI
jgi:uncharacterized protein (TIGR02147 family)